MDSGKAWCILWSPWELAGDLYDRYYSKPAHASVWLYLNDGQGTKDSDGDGTPDQWDLDSNQDGKPDAAGDEISEKQK